MSKFTSKYQLYHDWFYFRFTFPDPQNYEQILTSQLQQLAANPAQNVQQITLEEKWKLQSEVYIGNKYDFLSFCRVQVLYAVHFYRNKCSDVIVNENKNLKASIHWNKTEIYILDEKLKLKSIALGTNWNKLCTKYKFNLIFNNTVLLICLQAELDDDITLIYWAALYIWTKLIHFLQQKLNNKNLTVTLFSSGNKLCCIIFLLSL